MRGQIGGMASIGIVLQIDGMLQKCIQAFKDDLQIIQITMIMNYCLFSGSVIQILIPWTTLK